jgi:leader peptidase (prepilin peptidase)/N-methyltransferase
VERAQLERERPAAKAEGRDAEEPADLPQYTPAEVRREMRKEMLFLIPPMFLAGLFLFLTLKFPTFGGAWDQWSSPTWMRALLGSVFGLLIGGFVVWLTRILGTLAFGREAMGMGDVHLMAGVGAVIGAGASTVAFFIAPFFGIALAIYMLLTGTRREVPYGPYLSMGTAAVILFYADIANWLGPGLVGMRGVFAGWFS